MARLYADENIPRALVDRLRGLGHDVLTAFEAGQANQRVPDDLVLRYSSGLGRIVLTLNRKHFEREHRNNPAHVGILSITWDDDVEALAARVNAVLNATPDPAGQHLRVNRPG